MPDVQLNPELKAKISTLLKKYNEIDDFNALLGFTIKDGEKGDVLTQSQFITNLNNAYKKNTSCIEQIDTSIKRIGEIDPQFLKNNYAKLFIYGLADH